MIASICLLAYKRPEKLRACIKSLRENTRYPYELIVNLDGGDEDNAVFLLEEFAAGHISKLILNGGKNRGVGRSFANCVGVAEGDYIVKCDTDLLFKPRWLTEGINILEKNSGVGTVGFFDYRNYDPNDTRFEILRSTNDYHVVNDFVSSVYVFRRSSLSVNGWGQDDGFHQNLKMLAITKKDMVSNSGFGVLNSVYVSGTEDHPRKTETFSKPLTFKYGNQ